MTLKVAHNFVSAKADGTDASVLKPSYWNDGHAITLAANTLIGRLTAGAGAAEEVPLSTFMATLLAAADVTALAALLGLHTTGDFKLTIKSSADPGWVMCNDGTIGSATSGASSRANADCHALFIALYALPDAYAPVSGGRSDVTTDWTVNKTIGLTKVLGRALAIAGSGSGLSARAVGQILGEESHQIAASEMYPHSHGYSGSSTASGSGTTGSMNRNASHSHTVAPYNQTGSGGTLASGNAALGQQPGQPTSAVNTDHEHGFSVSIGYSWSGYTDGGSGLTGTPHNNMQPTSFVNVMMKL